RGQIRAELQQLHRRRAPLLHLLQRHRPGHSDRFRMRPAVFLRALPTPGQRHLALCPVEREVVRQPTPCTIHVRPPLVHPPPPAPAPAAGRRPWPPRAAPPPPAGGLAAAAAASPPPLAAAPPWPVRQWSPPASGPAWLRAHGPARVSAARLARRAVPPRYPA